MVERNALVVYTICSFIYLTDQIGSYIQAGGYGDSFTVEKRVYTDIVSYIHQKAGYPAADQMDEEGFVVIAGNHVKVKRQQVLSGETVRHLFQDFFLGTAASVEWADIDI